MQPLPTPAYGRVDGMAADGVDPPIIAVIEFGVIARGPGRELPIGIKH